MPTLNATLCWSRLLMSQRNARQRHLNEAGLHADRVVTLLQMHGGFMGWQASKY